LLNALGYLHNLGVVHRDIKLENIMVGLNGQTSEGQKVTPKLIDFGFSIVLCPEETTKDICGTLAYCSPEIVKKDYYDFKTDIWSMGIVSYAILRGKLPFIADEKK
jgi:serine/threonine protein kinase